MQVQNIFEENIDSLLYALMSTISREAATNHAIQSQKIAPEMSVSEQKCFMVNYGPVPYVQKLLLF